MADTRTVDDKLALLRQELKQLGRVLVAFSGGVDSTLLLREAVATLGGENVLAVISAGKLLPRRELDYAREMAERVGAHLLEVDIDEMAEPKFRANPADRCFHCKSVLFRYLRPIAERHGMKAIVTGGNVDDLADYRPGLRAVRDFGVVEPMAAAGLTKADIRDISRRYGLPTAEKPASPCLASRIPYGEEVTEDKLSQIEQGEAFLRSMGLADCRVRHHGRLVRLEVPAAEVAKMAQPEVRSEIVARFKELGFVFISLDLQGLRSGGLNEALAVRG